MTITIPTISTTVLVVLLSFSANVLSADTVLKEDIFLGVWSPWKTNWEIKQPVCVASSADDTFFTVTASGQHAGKEYSVSNDLSHQVNYQVYWHYGAGFSQSEMLRSGIQSSGVYRYDRKEQCSDGPGNQIRVELNKSQIDQAIAGIYNDTLLLVLSPI